MGLFDKFKHEKKEKNGLEALYDIPYDYDGYDVVFSQGKTKPELYHEISLIISNSKYDINALKEFHSLNVDSSIDEFYEFYDIWVDDLKNKKFMVHLDHDVLEANIVARELRKYNLELINFFDGFSNTEFAIIQASRIETLKALERKIK